MPLQGSVCPRTFSGGHQDTFSVSTYTVELGGPKMHEMATSVSGDATVYNCTNKYPAILATLDSVRS